MNNDAQRQYQDAIQAQLGERVTNINRRVNDLEVEVRSGFQQLNNAISALSANLADRNKPQWQAIGVALTFAALIGALAYWPIREATADLKTSVLALSEKMVTREEVDWRSARGSEDRARTEAALSDLRAGLVPRAEHERVWQNYGQRLLDHQRQIDEAKEALGSTYSLRDYIQRLTERLDMLEQRSIRSPPRGTR